MKELKAKEIAIIGLFVFAVCIIVLLLSCGFITIESISSFTSEFNKLFPNAIPAFLGAVTTLIGVFVGYFLSNRAQEKMLKVTDIRNELEKAYGILYSIVSKPEEMVKVDERTGTEERRVIVSREEKKELDRILMRCPHMFPREIVVLWRTEIRNLTPFKTAMWYGDEDYFGIPLKFKEKIKEEYNRRLEEYYKITGRGKSLEGLPKLARA